MIAATCFGVYYYFAHRRRLMRYQKAFQELTLALQARALLQSRFTIRHQDFGLPRGDEA